MNRYALRDDQSERIKDLLPGKPGDVGVTAHDNRRFVEAVLYRYRTGIPWRDLPERFGDWKNTHKRFSRWAKKGVWQRLFEHLAAKADNEYAMIDSTIGRAHQHRAGAQKNDDQAIGRSKGGLSTKIHALVDALGNPLRFLLTPGQAHDLIGADALLPQMAAEVLISDKAYDADEGVLKPLASAGKSTVIPPRQNRTTPRQFDEALYQTHHLIENSSVNSNSTAASPRVTIRPHEISSPRSTSPQLRSGLIDDRP